MKYYYPDNMEAPPMVSHWSLRDMFIIVIGGVLSLFLAVAYFSVIPLVPITVFGIVTITFPNGFTILAYIKILFKYLMSTQQVYFWR